MNVCSVISFSVLCHCSHFGLRRQDLILRFSTLRTQSGFIQLALVAHWHKHFFFLCKCFLCNIHTHSDGFIGEELGLASYPRICGMQTGGIKPERSKGGYLCPLCMTIVEVRSWFTAPAVSHQQLNPEIPSQESQLSLTSSLRWPQ